MGIFGGTKVTDGKGNESFWLFLASRRIVKIDDASRAAQLLLGEVDDIKIAAPIRPPAAVYTHLTNKDWFSTPQKHTSVTVIAGKMRLPAWDPGHVQREVPDVFDIARHEAEEEEGGFWGWISKPKHMAPVISGTVFLIVLCLVLMFGGGGDEVINNVPPPPPGFGTENTPNQGLPPVQ